jgi:hypothetical protein
MIIDLVPIITPQCKLGPGNFRSSTHITRGNVSNRSLCTQLIRNFGDVDLIT